MSKEIITLKDVSRKAGVHPSTVSLCLNNSPLVARNTLRHVQKIAREMGYHPHPHLQALMRSRRKHDPQPKPAPLGFVTFFSTPEGWKTRLPNLRKTIDAAREKAESRGFLLDEIWIPPERYSRPEIEAMLRERDVCAVLLSPLPQPEKTLDWPWERLAAVTIGHSLREPRINRVRSDHFKSMTTAMKACHRLGYRRPGLALHERVDHQLERRWFAAFMTTTREIDLGTAPRPFLTDDWRSARFLRWVEREKPDVIFVTKPSEQLRWLQDAGYSVPGDIGLVALSIDSPGSRFSGIYEHWELQGERGIRILIDLITDNEFGLQDSPIISLVDGSWNPGKTLRAPG